MKGGAMRGIVFGHPAAYARRTVVCAIALFTIAMACWVAAVAAQEPVPPPEPATVRSSGGPCFRARPYPDCRVFFITNSGAYVQLGAGPGVSPLRGTIDWGAMVNLSSTNAVGGSWFVTYLHEGTGFSTGPVVHWRRWLGTTRSLDVAVGTSIVGHAVRPGSVLGLVKYNPVDWLGVAVRPELVRYDDYNCLGVGCAEPVTRTKARFYLGAEAGGLPGLGLGVAAGVALGVILFAFLSHNN
jgi:hypothetical protein